MVFLHTADLASHVLDGRTSEAEDGCLLRARLSGGFSNRQILQRGMRTLRREAILCGGTLISPEWEAWVISSTIILAILVSEVFSSCLYPSIGAYGIGMNPWLNPGLLDHGASRGSGGDQDIAGLLHLGDRAVVSVQGCFTVDDKYSGAI